MKTFIILSILFASSFGMIQANEYSCGNGYGTNYYNYRDGELQQGWSVGYGIGCGYGYTKHDNSKSADSAPNYGVVGKGTFLIPESVEMKSKDIQLWAGTTVSCGDVQVANEEDIPLFESTEKYEQIELKLGEIVEIDSTYLVIVACDTKIQPNPWTIKKTPWTVKK